MRSLRFIFLSFHLSCFLELSRYSRKKLSRFIRVMLAAVQEGEYKFLFAISGSLIYSQFVSPTILSFSTSVSPRQSFQFRNYASTCQYLLGFYSTNEIRLAIITVVKMPVTVCVPTLKFSSYSSKYAMRSNQIRTMLVEVLICDLCCGRRSSRDFFKSLHYHCKETKRWNKKVGLEKAHQSVKKIRLTERRE